MLRGLSAWLLSRHLRAEGLFKNINLSSGGARSMIQGRRLGRPLLGKWHLCSFVVSVIGLSALSADSSPREAPPACQLHSIRAPRLLLFTVQAPSFTLLCLLVYIPLKLHRDLSWPLVAPVKRCIFLFFVTFAFSNQSGRPDSLFFPPFPLI